MINVLIVEDSPTMAMILRRIIESDPRMRVVYSAQNGEDALAFLNNPGRRERPDVITMDIVMPGMDGFTACRLIMERSPLPIVIASSAYKPNEAHSSFKAMEAGAVAIIEKPVSSYHTDYQSIADNLKETVRLMSEVKVVTRRGRKKNIPGEKIKSQSIADTAPVRTVQLAVIGSSTGGPPVLKTILNNLPKNLPFPLLAVQHIGNGFIGSMGDWLQSTTGFPVRIPVHGEKWSPGHLYLAPDNCQMGVKPGGKVILSDENPENGHRPSVSYLFRSAALSYSSGTIGVLLTGMGDDGAAELRMLKEMNAVTIAQDKKSSVIFGMPGEAVRLGAAQFVLPPVAIAHKIRQMAGIK